MRRVTERSEAHADFGQSVGTALRTFAHPTLARHPMKQIIELLNSNSALTTAWTAIAALFVSFLSIVLTTLSLWMQRTHDRKSVLPIGNFVIGDYEHDVLVRLRNDGNGPLIIENVTVFNTEKPSDSKSSIIDFMPDLPGKCMWETFVGDITGHVLSPQNELTLIELKGDPAHKVFQAAKKIVRQALSTLSVEITYRNIYDDRIPKITRRLDWFSRF